MSTLIVIDMQKEFIASSFPHVIRGVRKQIKEARKRKDGIIFLEYDLTGPTIKKVLDGVSFYDKQKWKRVKKEDDDGSKEAINALKEKQFNMNELILCGVNAEACVQRTANGLAKRLKKSKIIIQLEACGGEEKTTTKELKNMLNRKNITIKGKHKQKSIK